MNSAMRPSFKEKFAKIRTCGSRKKRAKCASQNHTYYNFLEKL